MQGKLDYARKFGKHDVGATFVYHMKETKKVKDGGDEYDLLPYREQGMAGRATYNYDMRYFLELTFGSAPRTSAAATASASSPPWLPAGRSRTRSSSNPSNRISTT